MLRNPPYARSSSEPEGFGRKVESSQTRKLAAREFSCHDLPTSAPSKCPNPLISLGFGSGGRGRGQGGPCREGSHVSRTSRPDRTLVLCRARSSCALADGRTV